MKSKIAFSVATVALMLGLSACANQGGNGPTVDFTAANFTSTAEVADASEYLVKATLISQPQPYTLPAADYLEYWVAQATVTDVVGQRPDAPNSLAVGQTIPIAVETLNPQSNVKVSDDADSFPTDKDLPANGDKIVAFLVYSPQLAAYGPGYQAVGYGSAGTDGNITMRGLPGKLKGQKVNAQFATTEAQLKMKSKAPWRQQDTTATVQPHTTGAPVAPPAS